LLILCLTFSGAEAAESTSGATARLILQDQWVSEGSPVWLRARLVTGSLFRSVVSGERVEFKINDRSFGPVLTGGDGVAAARYAPPKRGTYEIKAILADNPRYRAEEARAVLIYGTISRKVIVLSLEAAKTLVKPPPFPLMPPEPPQPMPQAVRVLTELSQKYQLIYIQSGDEAILMTTRDWLSGQDYPKAPVFVWRLSEAEEARTEQLTEELKPFSALGRFAFGITRSPAEARAFQALGIQAILILEEDEEVEVPEGVKTAADWDAVLQAVK
jgi:hypothetical protein